MKRGFIGVVSVLLMAAMLTGCPAVEREIEEAPVVEPEAVVEPEEAEDPAVEPEETE